MATGATPAIDNYRHSQGRGEFISFANVVAQEADPDRTNDAVAERSDELLLSLHAGRTLGSTCRSDP